MPNEARFSLLIRKERINDNGTLYCKTENIRHTIEMKKSIPPCGRGTEWVCFLEELVLISWKIKLNLYITAWHIVLNNDITKHILVHRYRALVTQSLYHRARETRCCSPLPVRTQWEDGCSSSQTDSIIVLRNSQRGIHHSDSQIHIWRDSNFFCLRYLLFSLFKQTS